MINISSLMNLCSGGVGLIGFPLFKGIQGAWGALTAAWAHRREMEKLRLNADIKYYPDLVKEVEETRQFHGWLEFAQIVVILWIMFPLTFSVLLSGFLHIPLTLQYNYMASFLGFPTHTAIGWISKPGFMIPLYLQQLGFFVAGMLFGTRFK